MQEHDTTDRLRVTVAGGGIAGVEALLALRELAADRVSVTLVSPGPAFRFRPFAVAQPFGLGHPTEVAYARLAADTGAEWVDGAVASVDPDARTVRCDDGREIGHDVLLLAAGGAITPGLDGATTWDPEGAQEILGGLLRDLEEGYSKSVAFVVGSGAVWPLPAYELALMTARDVRAMGLEARVTVVTPEPEPLAFLGPEASQKVAGALADAGVELVTGATATVRRDPEVHLRLEPSGATVEASRVVAMPVLRGRPLAGVPTDEHGFIPTDERMRVRGLDGVFAAGDGVVSPVKLGGLATHQARIAAREIARAAGVDVPEPDPAEEVVFDGVLMTGAAPVALTGDDAGGGATPVWWPARKVASRHLEAYLDEARPADPPPEGTPLRLTSAELLSLGRRMHEYQRR